MNGSLSQFKATQRRRADRNEKNNKKFNKKNIDYNSSNEKPEYNFPELDKNDLEDLKTDIKTKMTSENRKNFIIVLSTTIIFAVLIYFFLLT